jgi:RES domain-containing protein
MRGNTVARLPTLEELTERLESFKPEGISVEQDFFRSAPPKYASARHLISGQGAKLTGGRWNQRGVATIYLSDTPELALAESLAYARYRKARITSGFPRTFAAMHVKLSNVLDLTDGAVRRQLRISQRRMVATDWRKQISRGLVPLTHLLGQAAFDVGFEAHLVASATGYSGTNIAIFPENKLRGSRLRVLNAKEFTA